jgi:lysophospholipid acyltransferase (LPLAT)-like uncharacterized protein
MEIWELMIGCFFQFTSNLPLKIKYPLKEKKMLVKLLQTLWKKLRKSKNFNSTLQFSKTPIFTCETGIAVLEFKTEKSLKMLQSFMEKNTNLVFLKRWFAKRIKS